MLIGQELEDYLEPLLKKYGIEPHTHTNGLISCWICTALVVNPNEKPGQWCDDIADEIAKELGIKKS